MEKWPLQRHSLSNEDRARGRMKHRIGRVQRACWRVLVAARGRALRTSDILQWAYPGRPSGSWQRSVVRRAVRRWGRGVAGTAATARDAGRGSHSPTDDPEPCAQGRDQVSMAPGTGSRSGPPAGRRDRCGQRNCDVRGQGGNQNDPHRLRSYRQHCFDVVQVSVARLDFFQPGQRFFELRKLLP
jgi:hypothetical protein